MNTALLAILIYLVINAISLCAYAYDKYKAVEGKWRTRESTLLFFGFLGPWGAVIGMYRFHHKTQKPKFKLNFLFLILHIIGIALLVKYYLL
ncbi:MAG: DUF1294 domain-containing protein [Candidatus Methanomethylophilus sp.]|nr:transmembrane protein [methanogenic archaeon ISO4-H5]MBO5519068.1 DUF1294 domain-containing protein [Methanomethylophilus sp.]MBO5599502.1 DUF1294 domain-containing protein [Methanomethylophilus sp.]